jgi:hypothetical protein
MNGYTKAKVALAGPSMAGVVNLDWVPANLSRGGQRRRTTFNRGPKRGML